MLAKFLSRIHILLRLNSCTPTNLIRVEIHYQEGSCERVGVRVRVRLRVCVHACVCASMHAHAHTQGTTTIILKG